MRGGDVSTMSSTCIQGCHPRSLGGYQPNLIAEPHSPAPAWHRTQHPIIPKQERAEEERNDSGLASDSHSLSPGSENGQDCAARPLVSLDNSGCNNIPVITSQPATSTPVGYHPVNLQYTNRQTTPTINDEDDHLRRLQYALETNALVPHQQQPQSPKNSEHSFDDYKSDIEGEIDEQGLRIPRINSHGKVKKFRCKQCEYVAITKLDFWEHSKEHIKVEKRLTCPRCPFVTEYKHHLEYHMRNHVGSKPFSCLQCNYSCVNKSMLNSHLKSHSNVYQYRCADCSYAAKYCHSLKLHLRKYRHKPAMVLNPDGSPNPLPIIDVYGTRRGPKQKSMRKIPEEGSVPDAHNNPLTQFLFNTQPPSLQIPFSLNFLAGLPNSFANSMLFSQIIPEEIKQEEPSENLAEISEALDLSKPTSATNQPSKNRRKGPVFKLDHLRVNESSEEEDDEKELPLSMEEVQNNNNNIPIPADCSCQYCNISFGDIVLYTIHMGYHGFKDPFTCNRCGEHCNDKISFFLHIARSPHA